MVKLSSIEKEKKKFFLRKKYLTKIFFLKKIINNKYLNINLRNLYRYKLEKIPKNSFLVRKRNRCFLTGKPRGFYRRFGLSRNVIRNFSFKGYIPGLIKSS